MQSKATSVAQYLAEIPPDRRAALVAVRRVILENLDRDFEEGMQYGMIGYYVPHRVFPAGYHCDPKQPLPFAGLASQKNHMSIYMMATYGNGAEEQWLRQAWAKAGKKLDMGKCCIRFKKLEDLPLAVVGAAIRRVRTKSYIEHYQAALQQNERRAAKSAKTTSRKPTGKAAGVKRAPKTTKAPGRSRGTSRRG